jgi:hypothetical protein
MIGKILTSLGLGQDDLDNVFTKTLERLADMEIATADTRKGQGQAVLIMLDVLRDEDVMNSDTKKKLEAKLAKWMRANSPGPKRQ